jgi:hypothetical protein
MQHRDHTPRRPVITPVLTGVGAFAVFYVCALAARHVPVLNRAVSGVLQYARQGSSPFVLVLASAAMGTLLGQQRRATGGIQAPMLTHLTWSTLMLHFLPPLFAATRRPCRRAPGTKPGPRARSRSEDRVVTADDKTLTTNVRSCQ